MSYIQLQDMRLGMDRKRVNRVASEIGSAWTIKNAHLTRGGDVERRKKFTQQAGQFPSSTKGLFAINKTLYTVGYDSGEVVNVPPSISHILTQHPTPSTVITKVLDADAFDGKLYSIIEYDDGNIYHFYDTERVTDWDTLATSIGTNDAIAAALANALDQSPTVSATSSGSVVTVTGSVNDVAIAITTSTTNNGSNPDETLLAVVTQVHGGAQPQISEITVGGTFESSDQFSVILDSSETFVVTGGSSGTGTSILTFKQKLYSTAASNLYFCALNAPTQWISGLDNGFINMASQSAGQETLTAAREYQGLVAVFSENNIRVWSISEDSSANVILETVKNSGTVAPASVTSYGNNDVFYLSTSGIRSLKARDSSNTAYVSDVGTALDTHINEYRATLTESQVSEAVGVIEPVDGRLWMAIGKRVYVLSFFPQGKITAWSYYENDFQITHFAQIGDRIYARGKNDMNEEYLYLYGGTNNNEYPVKDEDICVIELPYLSAKDPAGVKEIVGFDIIATNNWKVDLLQDPSDVTVIEEQGVTNGTSFGEPSYGTTGVTTMFAVNLTCSSAGKATLSALALHYNKTTESG